MRGLTSKGNLPVLFGFDGLFAPDGGARLADIRSEKATFDLNKGDLEVIDLDPRISQQALLLAVDQDRFVIETVEGSAAETATGVTGVEKISFGDLIRRFSHLVRVRKVANRGRRAEQAEAAVRQWTLFARACPSRLIRSSSEDSARCKLAGSFWRGLAGGRRTPIERRLYLLAGLFEKAKSPEEIQQCIDLLLEIACLPYRLPLFVEEALRAPVNEVLSDIERRELIYLARAGTRDLRILAAARLRPERDFPDARTTLAQLAYDVDPWLREASREGR